MIKTYHALIDYEYNKNDFTYQKELTQKLENSSKEDFNQNLINEIVLWKVNRYAAIQEDVIHIINSINPNSSFLDIELTKKILTALLNTKGIRLPMASTILRFRNPLIYQIIDQRAYRFVYGKELKIPINKDSQIRCYIDYLQELRIITENKGWEFKILDRLLYLEDKKNNKDKKIKQ